MSIMLNSCDNQRDYDSLKGLELDFTEYLDFFENKEDVILLISFDGNCSACIVNFIEWLKKWNSYTSNEVKCYFISRAKEIYNIEYYPEKFSVKLNSSQYLIADPDEKLLSNNKLLDTFRNILLLNYEGKIITSKDPFSLKNQRKFINPTVC